MTKIYLLWLRGLRAKKRSKNSVENMVTGMEYSTFLNFRNLIKQLVEPSIDEFLDEQIYDFARLTIKTIYKADEYFSTPETPSTLLAYIAKGLFRLYVIDKDGNEVTLGFAGEDMFMSSYSAIILNIKNPIFIQALEDSEVYTISRMSFLKIWKTDVRWKDILTKLTELDNIKIRKRELDFLLYDAQTRYLQFLEDYSKYAHRIMLRHVASHLGISPETLSRIRNRTI